MALRLLIWERESCYIPYMEYSFGGIVAPSKQERFTEFIRRLGEATPASSAPEALAQLSQILNEVEDLLTEIPYNPHTWMSDGRMYPPQIDNKRSTAHPEVDRYRSRSHNTFIGHHGAIQIVSLPQNVIILDKPGMNGMKVSDLL
jgi:hypothetical protein